MLYYTLLVDLLKSPALFCYLLQPSVELLFPNAPLRSGKPGFQLQIGLRTLEDAYVQLLKTFMASLACIVHYTRG